MVTRGWEKGDNEELLFNEHRISPWGDGGFLELDQGDGCMTLWMFMMLLNCTLKHC